MKKLTELGRELRKLRIDKDQSLREMALKIEISSSYLSAIELGNKDIPEKFIEDIRGQYELSKNQINRFYECFAKDARKVKIDVSGEDYPMRELVVGFSRMANTPAERKQISQDLINKLRELNKQ